MPDHVHILARLGEKLSLAERMRQFKGRLTPVLRRHSVHGQDGYYDHQMREGEDVLPTFPYIYLNSYRAVLITPEEKWPGYFCAADDWEWFAPPINSETPFPEWLR